MPHPGGVQHLVYCGSLRDFRLQQLLDHLFGARGEFQVGFGREPPPPLHLVLVHPRDVAVVEGHGVGQDHEDTHSGAPHVRRDRVVGLGVNHFWGYIG